LVNIGFIYTGSPPSAVEVCAFGTVLVLVFKQSIMLALIKSVEQLRGSSSRP
jgi:hypothetical protein